MSRKARITFLGQAGLLFETADRKIMVDPYLSNSVEKGNPANYRRKPVDETFLNIHPDILILTHDHLDHTDLDTLLHYLRQEEPILVLASGNAWTHARKFGGKHNYVRFNRHTVWTEGELTFTAVYAEHSDSDAIGVIIDDGDCKYYITGDTLYSTKIFRDLPDDIDVVFLPINGVGNNMNQADAKRFAKRCGAKVAVPVHFGLFDELVPEGFEVVPEIYKEIIF